MPRVPLARIRQLASTALHVVVKSWRVDELLSRVVDDEKHSHASGVSVLF